MDGAKIADIQVCTSRTLHGREPKTDRRSLYYFFASPVTIGTYRYSTKFAEWRLHNRGEAELEAYNYVELLEILCCSSDSKYFSLSNIFLSNRRDKYHAAINYVRKSTLFYYYTWLRNQYSIIFRSSYSAYIKSTFNFTFITSL